MPNFITEPTKPSEATANLQVSSKYIDELYNRVWFCPGMETGTVAQATAGPDATYPWLSYADGAGEFADFVVRVKEEWNNHYAAVTIWFTSATGSTANFGFIIGARRVPLSGSMATLPNMGSATPVTAAGPASAYLLSSVTIELNNSIMTVQSDSAVRLRVQRDAGDANATTLLVGGIQWLAYPA